MSYIETHENEMFTTFTDLTVFSLFCSLDLSAWKGLCLLATLYVLNYSFVMPPP